MTVGFFSCGKIVATDLLPQRVEAAKAFRAYDALLTEGKLDVSLILAATDGRSVDVAFEAAGVQAAFDDAFAAVVHGGKD
jgi:threonine dehydrogenase-like Zn-dependent dehydrogenase